MSEYTIINGSKYYAFDDSTKPHDLYDYSIDQDGNTYYLFSEKRLNLNFENYYELNDETFVVFDEQNKPQTPFSSYYEHNANKYYVYNLDDL